MTLEGLCQRIHNNSHEEVESCGGDPIHCGALTHIRQKYGHKEGAKSDINHPNAPQHGLDQSSCKGNSQGPRRKNYRTKENDEPLEHDC
eukprot:5479182-Amphidinium_carterae.1